MSKRHIAAAFVGLVLSWPQGAAIAQIPKHVPGAICATQQFWCWAIYPGPPGTRCSCRSQNGWVPGVLV